MAIVLKRRTHGLVSSYLMCISDLPVSSLQISFSSSSRCHPFDIRSLRLYTPLLMPPASIGEVTGHKFVFIASMGILTVGSTVVATRIYNYLVFIASKLPGMNSHLQLVRGQLGV
ncbi:hypothetical protein GYMLUDRAFT_64799 [Collybiopsis luxurians FD-317 M1]|uniref:Uncharacterized protein n=1 Tax=Collybiopsis luxurians FD-317 M1 TaxID=944289 RepID=A0A0D0C9S5_9AGAR|nr:hypothetical protein GYMLUDRAFT_64799 [Collybiopsis luxurians FD-317 M1]